MLALPFETVETQTWFAEEQRKDPDLCDVIWFIENRDLQVDPRKAKKIALQAPLFTLSDDILYYIVPKSNT